MNNTIIVIPLDKTKFWFIVWGYFQFFFPFDTQWNYECILTNDKMEELALGVYVYFHIQSILF